MPDFRSKMASDIKRFMKDSRILEVKEFVKVTEALPYMSNLTAQAQQKIERKLETHGECVACSILYEEVTRNPRKLFPELLAALKKTKQHDVYARFKTTLHECRKEKSYKSLDEIMKLVKEEEAKKECERDSCDSDSDAAETDADARKRAEGSSTKTEVGQSKVIGDCGKSVVLKRDPRTPPLTKRPLSGDLLKVSPSRRDTKDKSIPLSSIRAKDFHELALCLQGENPEGEQWWNSILCNTPSLAATRKEQRDIERSMCQGKAFLDLLESKGFSIEDLEEMFKHHGMHHGHEMLQTFRKADCHNAVSESTMKLEQAAEVTESDMVRTNKLMAETKTSETVLAQIREPVTQGTEKTQRPVTIANAVKEGVVIPHTKVHAMEITAWATQTEVQENTAKRTGDAECRQTKNKETQTEESANDIYNHVMYMSLILFGFAFFLFCLSGVMGGHSPNIIIHIAK